MAADRHGNPKADFHPSSRRTGRKSEIMNCLAELGELEEEGRGRAGYGLMQKEGKG